MTLESSPSHSTPLSHGGASGLLTTSIPGHPSSSPAHPVSQSAYDDGSDDGSCKSSDCLSLTTSLQLVAIFNIIILLEIILPFYSC